jgi:hypothetical protein
MIELATSPIQLLIHLFGWHQWRFARVMLRPVLQRWERCAICQAEREVNWPWG